MTPHTKMMETFKTTMTSSSSMLLDMMHDADPKSKRKKKCFIWKRIQDSTLQSTTGVEEVLEQIERSQTKNGTDIIIIPNKLVKQIMVRGTVVSLSDGNFKLVSTPITSRSKHAQCDGLKRKLQNQRKKDRFLKMRHDDDMTMFLLPQQNLYNLEEETRDTRNTIAQEWVFLHKNEPLCDNIRIGQIFLYSIMSILLRR